MTTVYLQIELTKTEGRFVGKDALVDALIENLGSDVYVDDSCYQIDDVEQYEPPRTPKPRKTTTTKEN